MAVVRDFRCCSAEIANAPIINLTSPVFKLQPFTQNLSACSQTLPIMTNETQQDDSLSPEYSPICTFVLSDDELANGNDFDLLSDDSSLEECQCDFDSDSYASDDDNQDDDDDFDEIDHLVEPRLPPWFDNEDLGHLREIFKAYEDEFVSPNEFQRSHQPFIGRIKRLVSKSVTGDFFQTYDEVQIFNNQKVRPHVTLPLIRTSYVITTWNADGLPESFFPLVSAEQSQFWLKNLSDSSPSYLYCKPDWFQQAEVSSTIFEYSHSNLCQEVTYANLPWARAAYHCVSESLPLRCNSDPEIWSSLSSSPPAS